MQNGEGIAGVVSGGGRLLAVLVLLFGVVLVGGCGKSDKPVGKQKVPVSERRDATPAPQGDASSERPVSPVATPSDTAKPTEQPSVKPAEPATDEEKDGPNDGVFARITTNKGEILARLEYQRAPLTVTSFVGLAEGTVKHDRGTGPFYDGLTFHRVVPNFMIQGGCPMATGMGGPGYAFRTEISPALRHDGPGILSMANAGPNTNGSQFFITHVATPHLDGGFNVFGRVVKGQDVVNAIQIGDKIEKITIERIGKRAQAFKATQLELDALMKG